MRQSNAPITPPYSPFARVVRRPYRNRSKYCYGHASMRADDQTEFPQLNTQPVEQSVHVFTRCNWNALKLNRFFPTTTAQLNSKKSAAITHANRSEKKLIFLHARTIKIAFFVVIYTSTHCKWKKMFAFLFFLLGMYNNKMNQKILFDWNN